MWSRCLVSREGNRHPSRRLTFGLPVVPDEKHKRAIAIFASPGLNLCSTYGAWRSCSPIRDSMDGKGESGARCPSRRTRRFSGMPRIFMAESATSRLLGCATTSDGSVIPSWYAVWAHRSVNVRKSGKCHEEVYRIRLLLAWSCGHCAEVSKGGTGVEGQRNLRCTAAQPVNCPDDDTIVCIPDYPVRFPHSNEFSNRENSPM